MAEIRWHQRYKHYIKALDQLAAAVALSQQRALSELETQGLIQAFEFTHELSWNVLRDYFLYQGSSDITGSRDAFREAFKRGLVTDGEAWMEMISSRNQTSHAYNREIALEIAQLVITRYHGLFVALRSALEARVNADP